MKKIMFVLLFGGILGSLAAQSPVSLAWRIEVLAYTDDTTATVVIDPVEFVYNDTIEIPKMSIVPFSQKDKDNYINAIVLYNIKLKFFAEINHLYNVIASDIIAQWPNTKHIMTTYCLFIGKKEIIRASKNARLIGDGFVCVSEGFRLEDVSLERNRRKMEFGDGLICEYSKADITFPVSFVGRQINCYAYKQYSCGFVGFLTKVGWDIYTKDGKPIVKGGKDFYRVRSNTKDYPIPRFSIVFSTTAPDVVIREFSDGILLYVYKYPNSYEYIDRYSLSGERLEPIDNRIKK
ncbi:MAG: hypothetical protein WCH65_07250 [bacterium]